MTDPMMHSLAPFVETAEIAQTRARLIQGVEHLGLLLQAHQIQACLSHLLLLQRWNRTHNLTAVSALNDMVVLHTLDALSVVPYFQEMNEKVLDVGTGGGFPGIPLSIVREKSFFTLLDANHKKTSFVRACVTQLGLSNCNIVTGRVENHHVNTAYDAVTLRALADPQRVMGWVSHVLRPGGRLVLLMGKAPKLCEFEHEAFKLSSLEPIQVPNLSAQRHVALVIRR